MIEVHRSFVNTWECDENRHMNVRFYLRRFEDGAAVFLASRKKRGGHPQLRRRHVRYHSELHEAESTITTAAIPESGPLQGHLVQVMREVSSGRICATSADFFDDLEVPVISAPPDALETAQPKGLVAGDCESGGPVILDDYLKNGQAIVSNYLIVKPSDLGPGNMLTTDRIVACFSDGASHIWEHAGITTDWLASNNNGRVSVEMKVQPVTSVSSGEVLGLVSRVADRKGRTFRLLHALRRMGDRRVVAQGEVCCLVMNLDSRRAVQLPRAFDEYMAAQSL